VLKQGKGKTPKATDTVTANYRGTLVDGTVFDESTQPVDFPLNRVIAGWTEVLQLMKEGSKYQVFIPSELGYGADGSPGAIPPHSTLIFDIELISVEPPADAP
jgi:FKBP-type peptidyl-prolyl cis-trans isomerase